MSILPSIKFHTSYFIRSWTKIIVHKRKRRHIKGGASVISHTIHFLIVCLTMNFSVGKKFYLLFAWGIFLVRWVFLSLFDGLLMCTVRFLSGRKLVSLLTIHVQRLEAQNRKFSNLITLKTNERLHQLRCQEMAFFRIVSMSTENNRKSNNSRGGKSFLNINDFPIRESGFSQHKKTKRIRHKHIIIQVSFMMGLVLMSFWFRSCFALAGWAHRENVNENKRMKKKSWLEHDRVSIPHWKHAQHTLNIEYQELSKDQH